ncbi:MAG: lactate racemase domain-containing protein [Candidatus Acidiferrum sp.]
MSLLYEMGSEQADLTSADLKNGLFHALRAIGRRERVLAIPPDLTRFHSRAGDLTRSAHEFYGERLRAILPAVGTHASMTPVQVAKMFGDLPFDLFHTHNWRKDTVTLGEVPSDYVREQSEGKLDYTWPVQINRMLVEGGFDLILSIGQVVPHEVIGMANHNKNILVGTGGQDSIDRSHFLGAVYGMERIMGRADTPVRRVLNYASSHFTQHLPVLYVLTVVGRNEDGRLAVKGLFVGDDDECFHKASQLSLRVNVFLLNTELRKAVVYLNPDEAKSTWLGNKAIYRTRMALADGAELIVLAPGIQEFGEDAAIDRLIRKHGYFGTPATLKAVENDRELSANLSAAAHLIHGSSEGRFTVTYCPGGLSREEICGAGFGYGDLETMQRKYDIRKLKYGYNKVEGEDIFFVPNPGLGLWAYRGRFEI